MGCGEHCANLLVGDILKNVPWIKDVTRRVHEACRFIIRKKRCQQLVRSCQAKAKKIKLQNHTVKLKVVRKTRFC